MNHLFEISPMRNIKTTKKTNKIMQEIYDISYHYDLFTCGIQKKENKIRILCDYDIWNNILDDIYSKIKYNDLEKIGYEII